MSAVQATAPGTRVTPVRRERGRRWTSYVLPVYTAIVIFYLTSPILVMIVYGFNNSGDRAVTKWQGFTLSWYQRLFEVTGLTAALKNSLIVALVTTIVGTVLGTLLGLALGRYRFRGRGSMSFVIFLAIAAPEIVLGSSLLSMFVQLRTPIGLSTILLSHIAFTISFAAVTVRARVSGLDRSLEDAAQDLFASPLTTFWKVTLPVIFPGILSAALLSFALSIDDFVITNFVSGATETFPVWVFGASRIGIPPQVNVMGTLIFMFGAMLAAGNILLQRRKAKQDVAAAADVSRAMAAGI